ncbi:MAG: hypothetical protein M0024_06735 [Nitrospiraceae bacterium]|nr:hypothetical protein [Nitrospiraceae bacterium]
MGREEQIKTKIFQSAIDYVREKHPEAIDRAYAYFWDEQQPDEFIGGVALELGFINFEDWLIFDFKANEEKDSFLTIYSREAQGLGADELSVVDRIKGSILSLYEVTSVARDKRVLLKDLLLGEEISLRDKSLTKGLKKGDIFATRLLELDGNPVMSGCVYPFSAEQKKSVLAKIDKQFSRYARNVKKDGTMKEYLKDYGDVFNIIWMNFIADPLMEDGEPAEFGGN